MLFHAVSVCLHVCARTHAYVQFQLFNQSVDRRETYDGVLLLEDIPNTALLNRLRPVITSVTGEYMVRNGRRRPLHTYTIVGSTFADVATTGTLTI